MARSFISGMAITNDLSSVFCWVSQMASSLISCFISWDEIWIFRGSLMQQQGLLDGHGANRHQSAGQQTKQQHAQAVHADQQRGILSEDNRLVTFRRVEIH